MIISYARGLIDSYDIVKAVKLQSKVWYRFGNRIKHVNESV
jgi:hypothetical protein